MAKIFYNFRLMEAVAYVTLNWDNQCKERFITFCAGEWTKRGILQHMYYKLQERNEPVTMWSDVLDEQNRILLLKYLMKESEGLADIQAEYDI